MPSTNWSTAFKPLIEKYAKRKHPLEYKNTYQLLVMVILSAQDSDRHINAVAPPFFKLYPDLSSLVGVSEQALIPLLGKVRGHRKKIEWILRIANELKSDNKIPLTMDALTALPGIGRKSANVIMRESGVEAEGVVVDLHVVRVAPRLGIASGTDPKKIEQQIMDALPRKWWGEAGMALSFLGRETCRPSHPEHHECVMRAHCEYYKENSGSRSAAKKSAARTAAKSVKRAKAPSKSAKIKRPGK
jgi:endonuclease III